MTCNFSSSYQKFCLRVKQVVEQVVKHPLTLLLSLLVTMTGVTVVKVWETYHSSGQTRADVPLIAEIIELRKEQGGELFDNKVKLVLKATYPNRDKAFFDIYTLGKIRKEMLQLNVKREYEFKHLGSDYTYTIDLIKVDESSVKLKVSQKSSSN